MGNVGPQDMLDDPKMRKHINVNAADSNGTTLIMLAVRPLHLRLVWSLPRSLLPQSEAGNFRWLFDFTRRDPFW
jgi:hypothetical protein